MQTETNLSVVIQAGGQSSRMGQDKALMPFLGQPLIARLVDRLAGLGRELLITTNRPADYAFLRLPLIPDAIQGAGALGGLFTALQAAGQPVVAIVACDMPFVNPALLRAQYDVLLREGADVVIPRSPEGLEPLHAVYRREACLPVVKAALDAGERRVISWFSGVRAREMAPDEVAPVDPGFRAFMNVNSPEEFARAEEEALRQGGQ